MEDAVPLILFSLSLPVAIFAWLYQRAWERQTSRAAYYKSLLDCLPAFMAVSGNDPAIIAAAKERKNFFIAQVRHLWLVAPTDVVVAANAFLDAAKGPGDQAEAALKTLILQMRSDTSVFRVMFPFVSKSQRARLRPEDIKLYIGS